MNGVNWTEVLVAFVTVAGSTITAIFAARAQGAAVRAGGHAIDARASADVAVAASRSPSFQAPAGELESLLRIPAHSRSPTIIQPSAAPAPAPLDRDRVTPPEGVPRTLELFDETDHEGWKRGSQ